MSALDDGRPGRLALRRSAGGADGPDEAEAGGADDAGVTGEKRGLITDLSFSEWGTSHRNTYRIITIIPNRESGPS